MPGLRLNINKEIEEEKNRLGFRKFEFIKYV